jgi:prepilin-type processing-associated H-X9-DG protein
MDPWSTIPGWHRRDFTFNVTFADGHASAVEMKGTIRPAPNLGLQNYPANGCGNMSNWECWRCVTFRGPGWQLDTLPAPGVLTPWYYNP